MTDQQQPLIRGIVVEDSDGTTHLVEPPFHIEDDLGGDGLTIYVTVGELADRSKSTPIGVS